VLTRLRPVMAPSWMITIRFAFLRMRSMTNARLSSRLSSGGDNKGPRIC
jgi:hypothetical protein